MSYEKPKKDIVPYTNNNLPVPVNNAIWKTEDDDDLQPLENLMHRVDVEIARGNQVPDILRRRLLPQKAIFNDQQTMTDDKYADYALDFYRTKTSKGYNPAIGIRHLRSDIWDAVYFITRSSEEFSGKALRVVSIVETCMIHLGLHGLDFLLAGRPKLVEDRLQAIRKGGKEKRRRGKPAQYSFVNFTDTLDKQQNVWCLSPEDYARAATMAEDYGWDMGFVVQIAMVIAIASSEKLPESLRKDAVEEVKFFGEYLDRYYR